MVSVKVFVHFRGSWEECNDYSGYSVCGLFVPEDCTYNELMSLIAAQLDKDLEKHQYILCYQEMLRGPRVQINNDYSLSFFLEINKGEVNKRSYPLCIAVCELAQEPEDDRTILMPELDVESTHSHSLVMQDTYVSDPFTIELERTMPTIEEMGEELAEYITLQHGENYYQ